MKNRNVGLIILGMLMSFSFFQWCSPVLNKDYTNINAHECNGMRLRSAGSWNLTGTNIIIDDLDPARNWSYTESNYDWCSGSGTWSDPYVIENVTINGEGSRTCITIQNSNVFFKIKNCTLYNAGTGPTRMGIKLDNVQDGLLINNSCVQNGMGIYLVSCHNITVLGNNASYNIYSGIYVRTSSQENEISGNIASDNLNSGIAIVGSSHFNTISNNTANNNNYHGIYLYSINHCKISNNTINNNGDASGNHHGIYLYSDCNNNNLTGNNAHYNDWGGICIATGFDEPHNNMISRNRVSHNRDGIYLDGDVLDQLTTYSNTINNNFAYQNNYGIYLFYARNNNLFENNLTSNNQYGICVRRSGSINNIFYKNRFIGNPDNARDEVAGNQWDNGIIGNYYDDYVGEDKDDDGIGDTPYTITGSVIDNFPIWDDGDDIPIINISKPLNGMLFGPNPPNYEVSIFAADLNTSWYSLNNGLNYTFTTMSGIINQSAWDACDDGTVKIEFFANDTAGNLVRDEVHVYKDTIFPTSVIHFIPLKEPNIVNKSTLFSILADDMGGSGIFQTKFKINNSNWNNYLGPFTLINFNPGTYNISYYSIDNAGNIEEIHSIIVVLIEPQEPKPSSRSTILGYNIFLLFGAIFVVSIIIMKKR